MALGGMSRPLETRRRRKMMQLRNMVGIAFFAMSLLTGSRSPARPPKR
jgi:hypothetical protein